MAEVGVNHNSDLLKADQLTDDAEYKDFNAVKFQTCIMMQTGMQTLDNQNKIVNLLRKQILNLELCTVFVFIQQNKKQ